MTLLNQSLVSFNLQLPKVTSKKLPLPQLKKGGNHKSTFSNYRPANVPDTYSKITELSNFKSTLNKK